VTVEADGFSKLVRSGLDLAVGQTINLRLEMKLSTVEAEITVTGEAPVVETGRTEGSTRIDQRSVEKLPNNGRNFLDYTKLTPGVTIVQGPDGDELSINGQKGISNNVAVDGADFNNPFFGEQRGGQRPASPSTSTRCGGGGGRRRQRRFGRSASGSSTSSPSPGPTPQGTVHPTTGRQPASRPDAARRPRADRLARPSLGGPIRKDKVFYFLSADSQRGRSTKQTDPNRIEQRVVDYFASIGDPGEYGPIERTNDARVLLAKTDWQASDSNLVTLRYTYTWAEQENGTFDVDSWGRSANAIEKSSSNAGTGSVISTLSSSLLNELRFQYAREDRPRPYRPASTAGRFPTPPSTSAAPTASACRSSSRSSTTTSATRSTTTSPS
jgi:hypothetical protein